MNLTITRKKLRAWIDLLTADHLARGVTWYSDARVFAEALAKTYHVDLRRAVGILAVLSVQNRWDINKRDAEALIRAKYEGLDLASVNVATYDSQKKKAIAILQAPRDADIYLLIGTKYAPKTRAFYDNILHPDTSFRVTIDRWILRGLDLDKLWHGGAGNSYIALYRNLEELFRAEAVRVNLRPCELQAAVWCCIQSVAEAESWADSRPHSGLAPEPAPEPAPF